VNSEISNICESSCKVSLNFVRLEPSLNLILVEIPKIARYHKCNVGVHIKCLLFLS